MSQCEFSNLSIHLTFSEPHSPSNPIFAELGLLIFDLVVVRNILFIHHLNSNLFYFQVLDLDRKSTNTDFPAFKELLSAFSQLVKDLRSVLTLEQRDLIVFEKCRRLGMCKMKIFRFDGEIKIIYIYYNNSVSWSVCECVCVCEYVSVLMQPLHCINVRNSRRKKHCIACVAFCEWVRLKLKWRHKGKAADCRRQKPAKEALHCMLRAFIARSKKMYACTNCK